jgi:hypothetical protein
MHACFIQTAVRRSMELKSTLLFQCGAYQLRI